MPNYDYKNFQPIDRLTHEAVKSLQPPLVAFLDGIAASEALTEIAHPTRRFQKLKHRVAYLKQPFTSSLALPAGLDGLPRHEAYAILSMLNSVKQRYAHSHEQPGRRRTPDDMGEQYVRCQFLDIVTASLLNPQQIEHLTYALLAESKFKKRNASEIRACELAQATLARHVDAIIYRPFKLTDKLGLRFDALVNCYSNEYFRRKWNPPVDDRFK